MAVKKVGVKKVGVKAKGELMVEEVGFNKKKLGISFLSKK